MAAVEVMGPDHADFVLQAHEGESNINLQIGKLKRRSQGMLHGVSQTAAYCADCHKVFVEHDLDE